MNCVHVTSWLYGSKNYIVFAIQTEATNMKLRSGRSLPPKPTVSKQQVYCYLYINFVIDMMIILHWFNGEAELFKFCYGVSR